MTNLSQLVVREIPKPTINRLRKFRYVRIRQITTKKGIEYYGFGERLEATNRTVCIWHVYMK